MKVSNSIFAVAAILTTLPVDTAGFFHESCRLSFDATALFPPNGDSEEHGGFGRGRGRGRGRGDRGRGRGGGGVAEVDHASYVEYRMLATLCSPQKAI